MYNGQRLVSCGTMGVRYVPKEASGPIPEPESLHAVLLHTQNTPWRQPFSLPLDLMSPFSSTLH